jgi:hypothetical protein
MTPKMTQRRKNFKQLKRRDNEFNSTKRQSAQNKAIWGLDVEHGISGNYAGNYENNDEPDNGNHPKSSKALCNASSL